MQEPAATTVVLADDHAIVREGIAALCASHGMRVLGQVADGNAAVEMIASLNPDFAILTCTCRALREWKPSGGCARRVPPPS